MNAVVYSVAGASGQAFLDAIDGCSSVESIKAMLAAEPGVVLCRGRFNRDALFFAARKGRCDVLALLLGDGAEVLLEAKNDHGFTALYTAALHGQTEAIRVLIAKGADVGASDLGGLTPLHIAAEKGYPACVAALLTAGATPAVTDSIGRTALDWARDKGHAPCVALLEAQQ